MKIIILSTFKHKERYENALKIKAQLPEANIYTNDNVNNFYGFIEALTLFTNDDVLFIEDDAKLCSGFNHIAFEFIAQNSNRVIEFMDLKRANFTTQEMAASTFCMSVCVYLHKHIVKDIIKLHVEYLKDTPQHPKAHDYLIGYVLKLRKERYILHRPCLAQHLSFRSVAHPGASMGRQTKFFIDDIK